MRMIIKDVRALLRFLSNPDSELRAAALCRSWFARLSDPAITALAGGLAAALVGDDLPQSAELLPPDDRAYLDLLREGLSVWLPIVGPFAACRGFSTACCSIPHMRESFEGRTSYRRRRT